MKYLVCLMTALMMVTTASNIQAADDKGKAAQAKKEAERKKKRDDREARNKAIKDFMAEQPFRDRCPVFIGDDRGDEHGFRYVERCGGWSVKVGPGSTVARYRLPDVTAVLEWLSALANSPAGVTP